MGYVGLTFTVHDHPAVIFGSVLRDLLAGELHGLLVVAVVIHGSEAYMLKLCSKRLLVFQRSIAVLCIVSVYLYNDGTSVVALQEKSKRWRIEGTAKPM